MEAAERPPVRSYHARGGRLSGTKRATLARLTGLAAPPGLSGGGPVPGWGLLDPPAPTVVEIGAGTGEAAIDLARREPARNVVAVEVHPYSLAVMLQRWEDAALPNLAVVAADGADLLRSAVTETSLAEIRIFFPDPWPKSGQRRRRLLQPGFAAVAAGRLVLGGELLVATDDAGYAHQIREVLTATVGLRCHPGAVDGWAPRAVRTLTHYEAAALDAGRRVYDLRFQRV